MLDVRDCVFVFGSNLAGRHGKGAALDAVHYWGAQPGVGIGRVGNSYAIPTKDQFLKPLSLEMIGYGIRDFIYYANQFWWVDFQVTRIGCGLAGYNDKEIAPLFRGASSNVHLPLGWRELSLG